MTRTEKSWATLMQTTWFRALLLGVLFFALGRLAGEFVFPPQRNAVLWLPSGLSLAVFLNSRLRSWPGLLAAIFLAELTSVLVTGLGVPLEVALAWSVGNCLRTLLGAWLVRRWVGTPILFNRVWDVVGLVLLGGLIGTLPSATIGSGAAWLWMDSVSFAQSWVFWWISDALGTVLVAPVILTWWQEGYPSLRRSQRLEMGMMLVGMALVAEAIFGTFLPQGLLASLAYACFPFVLWAALRLGPRGAASASAVLGIIAVWHTLHGRGPFGVLSAPMQERVLSLQTFLATLSLSALTLATLASERRRSARIQRLLADVGAVLAESLNYRETFPRVARLVVPEVCAGFCLWVQDKDGHLERVAQAGIGFEREALLRGKVPLLPTAVQHWNGPRGSVVLVPLWERGHVQGALALVRRIQAPSEGARALALAEDLAYRCSMALESARLFEEARDAIAVRDEFITIAAHELRTPLTALKLRLQSMAEFIRRSPNAREYLPKIHVAARQLSRLSQLAESMLDVVHLHGGRMELHREEVEVSGLVEEVAERFSEEASRAGCQLRVKLETNLIGRWDRRRVEQALSYLLANAIKFGKGRPIELEASRVEEGVRLIVRDHGIGIAPEAMERIFERFERAVSVREYGGLGLGLFLSRQIAEAHGGSLHATSQPGAGTIFVLSLPALSRVAARPEELAPPTSA